MLPRAFPTEFTPKLISVLREGYNTARLRADMTAGLTVAIVALPLSMALGIASGATPDKGLITAVVAGLLISALGGSRVQIGGPTGAFVVIVFNVIAQHGYDGLVLATLLAGIILALAGYMRLGGLVRFIPHPVVTGFTAGIAVIIASSQVKDFLGLRITAVPADFLAKWAAYLEAIETISPLTIAIGVAGLATIIILRKMAPRIPGFLVSVVLASVVVAAFALPVDTIGSRFPHMATGVPMPHLPDFSTEKVRQVLPSAFTIAFLAGIESLLSAVVADGMTGFRHRSNQEMVGQGVANFASAMFGGLPATGAIARTATNIKAGGRSPVAGISHAVFILLFILFGSKLMAFVPMAALAAILFIVAWGMSEYRHFLGYLRMPNGDRLVLLLTFGLTVLVDLTVAIGVGVTLASLIFMARMSSTVEFGTGFDTEDEDLHQRDTIPPGVEVFRMSGPFFFGVVGGLMDTFRAMSQQPRAIILRMRLVPMIDASGATALERLVDEATRAGIHVILSGVQPQPQEMLRRVHLSPDGKRIRFADDFAAALRLAE
ncbi:sodium-independent anion transporter (plasmid) [Sphingobium sp. SCG-1]|uniref:SulP family inorganic anion transporter n=1 Tax=Sphingobium sp. SCG-1 TaxID=2072936 RepID=UPI000CD687A3|nr:SulP family inorganic anion transporter [Sphingobium sp. SCG-1]AUW60594.1 sodium-independent anion transporter [Sphingobium sp. SCG-1]